MLYIAFGQSVMNETRVYEWYKYFQKGCKDFEDDVHPGHSSTSTTEDTVAEYHTSSYVHEFIKKAHTYDAPASIFARPGSM